LIFAAPLPPRSAGFAHRLARVFPRAVPSPQARAHQVLHAVRVKPFEGADMAKYLIAWILGVPAIILVLIYLLFH
jgi:hypothetical protein